MGILYILIGYASAAEFNLNASDDFSVPVLNSNEVNGVPVDDRYGWLGN